MALMRNSLVGTAGWSVPLSNVRFVSEGSALERYASVFDAVEINSSFYRRHRLETWQRWRDAVPEEFRFSVKLPRTITHERQFVDAEDELDIFFADTAPLGEKLGAILVQLPPSFAFDAEIAATFFTSVRVRSVVPIFLEPRHKSWAAPESAFLLKKYQIERVYADPQDVVLKSAALAAGSRYLRLHGSPRIYYSAYTIEQLNEYAGLVTSREQPCWCIFDNTASGAALVDAIKLFDLLA